MTEPNELQKMAGALLPLISGLTKAAGGQDLAKLDGLAKIEDLHKLMGDVANLSDKLAKLTRVVEAIEAQQMVAPLTLRELPWPNDVVGLDQLQEFMKILKEAGLNGHNNRS